MTTWMTNVWEIFNAWNIWLMLASRLTVVEFSEWQCMVVMSNEKELCGCLLTECEGSNTVLYFALSYGLELSTNTFHVLVRNCLITVFLLVAIRSNVNCERGVKRDRGSCETGNETGLTANRK